jgi:putative DNA primase/helicase
MIAKTPRLKAIMEYGNLKYLTDTIILDKPEESRADAFLKVLVYNHFATKQKIRVDQFCKKRCSPSLTAEEITKATTTAAKKIREIEAEEQTASAAAPAMLEMDYKRVSEIIRERHHIIAYLGVLYRYVDGVYIHDKEGMIDSEIITELNKIESFEADDDITKAAQQVKHYIKFEKPEKEYPFNKNHGLFNVNNGVVKIDYTTGDHELISHSPEYKFNYKLVVDYDENAQVESILKYIESLGMDIKDILVQIPAHCLLSIDGHVFKKAYFFMGGQDSGKTTLIQMLALHFFGTPVCSSLSLQELLYDRFKRANLVGKLLNYYGDLPSSKISDAGTFKNLTGGDGISIERKGIQAEENFINRAVFVFSANNYPAINVPEDGGVFWDRWIAVRFNGHFSKDPQFPDKMFTKENMSGLLNLVLLTIPKILKNGLTTSDSIMDEWMRDSDSSYEFIKKTIEPFPGAVIVKGSIYQEYQNYCIENELSSVDIRVFSKTMGKKPFAYRTDSQHKVQGKVQHCYTDCKRIGDMATMPDGWKDPAAGTATAPGPNKTLATDNT